MNVATMALRPLVTRSRESIRASLRTLKGIAMVRRLIVSRGQRRGNRRSRRGILLLVASTVLTFAACATAPNGPPASTGPTASNAEGVAPAVDAAIPDTSAPPPELPASPGVASYPAVGCTPTDQDRYVYNPDRLVVKARCLRVSGVIDAVRQEADGDLHILLRLDAPYQRYLTPANQGQELGDLVVEPVCVHPVSQADAIAPCAADPDPIQNLPHTGMRVWMEGRYVLDMGHGGWAELHPLYRWGPATTSGSLAPGTAPTPIARPTGTGLSVRFTDVPSPAPIGGSSTIGATTSAGATCSIRVTLPSGRTSTTAALLVTETANGSGNVSWTWKIRSNTRAGTATALVSCTLGSKGGSATTTFSMQ